MRYSHQEDNHVADILQIKYSKDANMISPPLLRTQKPVVTTQGTSALKRFGAGFLGALLLGASAQAQTTITWEAAHDITGDTDVVTTGTLVDAFNLGSSEVPATTVNGVTFSSFEFPHGSSVTLGNYHFVEDLGVLVATNNWGYGSGEFASLSASYQSLLSSAAGASVPLTLTLTISGLETGAQYMFQWWNNRSQVGYSFVTSATAGNELSLESNTGDSAGTLGQFGIGYFTANGATMDIAFNGAETELLFNAFQLRNVSAVPEPASAVAGFGVLALGTVMARRRRTHYSTR